MNGRRAIAQSCDVYFYQIALKTGIERIHNMAKRMGLGEITNVGIPDEKVIKTVQDHGNTSAASIPLALSVASKSGQIEKNDLIVTEAIGGGLAWGAIVLRW